MLNLFDFMKRPSKARYEEVVQEKAPVIGQYLASIYLTFRHPMLKYYQPELLAGLLHPLDHKLILPKEFTKMGVEEFFDWALAGPYQMMKIDGKVVTKPMQLGWRKECLRQYMGYLKLFNEADVTNFVHYNILKNISIFGFPPTRIVKVIKNPEHN